MPRAETPKECVHAVTEASPSSAQHAQAGEQSEAEERQQYQFYMQGNLTTWWYRCPNPINSDDDDLQSDPNLDYDKASKTSRESFRGRQSQGNPEQLTSPVSVSGPEIPKILVHTFTREETVESTLSGENNGLNNV